MTVPATFDKHFYPPITTAGGTVEVTHPHSIPEFTDETVFVHIDGAETPVATLHPNAVLQLVCPIPGWRNFDFRTAKHTESVRYLVVTAPEQEHLASWLAQTHGHRYQEVAARWQSDLEQRHPRAQLRFPAMYRTEFLRGMANLLARSALPAWLQAGAQDRPIDGHDVRQECFRGILRLLQHKPESYDPFAGDFEVYFRTLQNHRLVDVQRAPQMVTIVNADQDLLSSTDRTWDSEAHRVLLLGIYASGGSQRLSKKHQQLLEQYFGATLGQPELLQWLAEEGAKLEETEARLFELLGQRYPAKELHALRKWHREGSVEQRSRSLGTRQAITWLIDLASECSPQERAFATTAELVRLLCLVGKRHTVNDKRQPGTPELMAQIRGTFRQLARELAVHGDLRFAYAQKVVAEQFVALRMIALTYTVAGCVRQRSTTAQSAYSVLEQTRMLLDRNPSYLSFQKRSLLELNGQSFGNFDEARDLLHQQLHLAPNDDLERLLSELLLLKVFPSEPHDVLPTVEPVPEPSVLPPPAEGNENMHQSTWKQMLNDLEKRWDRLCNDPRFAA